MEPQDRARTTVRSDYICPFCYLEEPVLERIRDEGEQVEMEWRAFELRPEPVPTPDPDGEFLHTTWNASVYPMAERRGMTLRLPGPAAEPAGPGGGGVRPRAGAHGRSAERAAGGHTGPVFRRALPTLGD